MHAHSPLHAPLALIIAFHTCRSFSLGINVMPVSVLFCLLASLYSCSKGGSKSLHAHEQRGFYY